MQRSPEITTPAWRAGPAVARRLSLIAGAAATVIAIAACGSSTKASSTTTSSTSSTPISTVTTTPTTTPTTTTSAKHAHAAHHKPAAHPKKTTTTTKTQASTTTHPTTTTHTTPASKPKPKPPTFVGPIKATLVGENHTPIVNKLWPYTVTVTDAKGRPLPGRVDIEFALNGSVVGHATPPTDPLTNGRWHDNLTFPPPSVGIPLDLQVVVHTPIGTTTLEWPVKAKR